MYLPVYARVALTLSFPQGEIVGLSSTLNMATKQFTPCGVFDVFEKPLRQSEVTRVIAGLMGDEFVDINCGNT